MEIHRFERLWLALSLLLILGITGTVVYGATAEGIKMVDDSGGTIDAENLQDTEFGDPGVRKVGENRYDVYIVAHRFFFDPGTSQPIEIPAESTVTFYVTSADVVHGFQVADTNVNTMVIPGQVAKLTVEFDNPDSYGIICHEYCGSGHHSMEGELDVVPKSEYNATEASA